MTQPKITLHYDCNDHPRLSEMKEELFDRLGVQIYTSEDLDLLVRREIKDNYSVFIGEMVPLKGRIIRTRTPWASEVRDLGMDFKAVPFDGYCMIGASHSEKPLMPESGFYIWLSQEAYLKKGPNPDISVKDPIMENMYAPKEPKMSTIIARNISSQMD